MSSYSTEQSGEHLAELKLPRYDTLPAFGIYVDQLISFVNDAVKFSYTADEKPLTASMVNNYVKQEVVPKPEKKKYTRDHVARLIVVCILKKVFSIHEITELIQMQVFLHSPELAYDSFVSCLERSVRASFFDETTEGGLGDERLDEGALLVERAVLSFSNKLFVQVRIANKARDTLTLS